MELVQWSPLDDGLVLDGRGLALVQAQADIDTVPREQVPRDDKPALRCVGEPHPPVCSMAGLTM